MTAARVGSLLLVTLALLVCPAWAEPADSPAKPVETSGCNRAQFRVILDVGHTPEAPGATSARGVSEYDFNLRLAKQAEQALIDAGFGKPLLLLTSGPAIRGLLKRVQRANSTHAQLFLSIHHDSVPLAFLKTWEHEGKQRRFSDEFKGHSIFISYDNSDRKGSLLFGKLLGQQLKNRDLQYTPHYTEARMGNRRRELLDPDTGVYRYDKLVVLRSARMPAVLLEAGSIINRDEEELMASSERQALIASAVVDAVEAFCAARAPQRPERIARRPRPQTAKPLVSPAASTQQALPTTPQ